MGSRPSRARLAGAAASLLPASAERERLLAAAARAFGERGWCGTRVDEVEAEVGLEPGQATRLVGSKAELLWLAMGHAMDLGGQDLEDVVASLRLAELGSVDERLDAVVGLVCRVHEAIAPLMPAVAESALVDPAALAMRQGSDLRRLAVSRDIVAALTRGAQPVPDAAETAHVLMMTETYATFARNGWSMQRYAAWLRGTLDRCVNGDRAAPRAAPPRVAR